MFQSSSVYVMILSRNPLGQHFSMIRRSHSIIILRNPPRTAPLDCRQELVGNPSRQLRVFLQGRTDLIHIFEIVADREVPGKDPCLVSVICYLWIQIMEFTSSRFTAEHSIFLVLVYCNLLSFNNNNNGT
jgi:hypothetical protein